MSKPTVFFSRCRDFLKSLRFRLLAGSVGILALLAVAILWNGYRLITDAMEETIHSAIAQTGQILNLAVSPYTTSNDLNTLEIYLSELLWDEEGEQRGLRYVTVVDEEDRPLLRVGDCPEPLPKPDAQKDWQAAIERGLVHVRQPVLLWDNSVGYLQYGLSTMRLRHAMRESIRQGILIVLISIALAGLTGLYVVLSVVHRIDALIETTAAIASGECDRLAPEDGRDELSRLSHYFNLMVVSIRSRQKALEFSERSLRATVENTPHVAIQWYDEQGRVVLWNRASETLYGIPAEQAFGKTLDQLIFSPEQAAEFLAMLHEIQHTGKALGPYNARFHRSPGEICVILYTLFGISRPDGKPLFVRMDVDITERVRNEAELERRVQERTEALSLANRELVKAMRRLRETQSSLVRSEKLASLGSLVAGVAHELNTPLGTALTVATTLRDRTEEFLQETKTGLRRSTLNAYVDMLQSTTELLTRNLTRAADLITSFKHVAVDQTSSQRRKFELRQVIHEVIDTLRYRFKKTPYQLVLEIPENIRMDSYPGPLGQVLTNLLDNALIHGLDGCKQGKIRIQVSRMGSDWIRLKFCDDGVGIPAEHQGRLFDPFFTTRLGQGGSGLGLNIVHNIVEGVLGGTIQVKSAPGKGTCFILELPQTAPERKEVSGPANADGHSEPNGSRCA